MPALLAWWLFLLQCSHAYLGESAGIIVESPRLKPETSASALDPPAIDVSGEWPPNMTGGEQSLDWQRAQRQNRYALLDPHLVKLIALSAEAPTNRRLQAIVRPRGRRLQLAASGSEISAMSSAVSPAVSPLAAPDLSNIMQLVASGVSSFTAAGGQMIGASTTTATPAQRVLSELLSLINSITSLSQAGHEVYMLMNQNSVGQHVPLIA